MSTSEIVTLPPSGCDRFDRTVVPWPDAQAIASRRSQRSRRQDNAILQRPSGCLDVLCGTLARLRSTERHFGGAQIFVGVASLRRSAEPKPIALPCLAG
jgi:hypothetical protein